MKKVSKSSRTNELLADVIEYAFIEWLVRRGTFSAFKANYKHAFMPYKSFRDHLHSHIRHSLRGFGFSPRSLITSSFFFASTPEGSDFWRAESAAWGRFCDEFKGKF